MERLQTRVTGGTHHERTWVSPTLCKNNFQSENGPGTEFRTMRKRNYADGEPVRPRDWPVPASGQVLSITRRHGQSGWLSAYFWPVGTGFHFVTQAFDGTDWCIEDASSEPLAAEWIVTIGRTTAMLRGGGIARLVQGGDSLMAELEGWRTEIATRRNLSRLGVPDRSGPPKKVSSRTAG